MSDSVQGAPGRISVSREPDVRRADESGWVLAQSYSSLKTDDLIRAVHTDEGLCVLRSGDNGETWSDGEVVARERSIDSDRALIPSLDAFYVDPDNGLLVRFLSEYVAAARPGVIAYADAVAMGPRTRRLFYQVSRDGGGSWEPRQQIVEKGSEYDAEHWARDVRYGQSSLCLEGRRLHKLADGTLVAPCYLWPSDEHIQRVFREENRSRALWDDAKYYIHAVCLLGRWREDLSGIEWESGGPLLLPGGCPHAGTCGSDEPTIAFLDDGRWFAVVRTSTSHVKEFREKNIPVLPYAAVSSDGGRTWRDARPLTYSDGAPLYAPSAYSEFIHSSRNGKWYWIGNILPGPTYGNCDPRHPLQIGELDPRTLGIKRETVTVVEDKATADPDLVRFSNFRIYEERGTKDFILLMTKSYCELQEGLPDLPRPSYRYHIRVPD